MYFVSPIPHLCYSSFFCTFHISVFLSEFVNLTLFICYFFLLHHIGFVFPVYPYSFHLQEMLYATLAFFSTREVFAFATRFLTVLSAMLVVLDLYFAVILSNLCVNPMPNKNNSSAAFKKPLNYSLIFPALWGVKWWH